MLTQNNLLSEALQVFSDLPPVVRELPADLETPVSVYLKLAGEGPSFLLESITGGENLARYSFIGVHPRRACVLHGRRFEVRGPSGCQVFDLGDGDPLDALRRELAECRSQPLPGLPRFNGGLVGYMGYEMMRFFEPNVSLTPHADQPDAIFLLADTLVAFDHAFGRLILIARPRPAASPEEALSEAGARLDAIQARLDGSLPSGTATPAVPLDTQLHSNRTREQFNEAVEKAKEHITAGDIFQIVLSQRLSRETTASPFSIYRALRSLNPSPYMFFFDFADLAGQPGLQLIGASPELHVRLEGRRAAIRPIAGTRPRSSSVEEDAALERELLADPKERAEHVMLVDLARNDLGRVCQFGSVRVPEQMVIERYSHVMHIVSHVEGTLRPELDAFDLMKATFPAGTVSGAPKIRAMQIINRLEKEPRGLYAGAVGYFAADGSMDTCIAIRTMWMRGSTVSVQAGAGIVADSNPDNEYQESLNKARALAVAVEMAETHPVFSRSMLRAD
ncbi:MAG: anthranilate synthase component I [Anaerolineae bacterium]|nr:anthranilate synthase component I [Anaerolineae bacterium]